MTSAQYNANFLSVLTQIDARNRIASWEDYERASAEQQAVIRSRWSAIAHGFQGTAAAPRDVAMRLFLRALALLPRPQPVPDNRSDDQKDTDEEEETTWR